MKYNKIVRILGIAVILSLLVAAVPATPAQATVEHISISQAKAKIGEDIYIYGFNFDAGERVYLYFSSYEAEEGDDIDELDAFEYLGRDRADDEGRFEESSDVPDELSSGDYPEDVHGGKYYVYATYTKEGRIVAVDDFIIIAIELEPKEGNVGHEIEISGAGFKENRDIKYIKYDGDEVDFTGDDKTNDDGEFTCTIIISESTAGGHTVRVKVRYDEARADFTVEPEITISPTSGLIGDTVTVSGTGFGYKKDVTIYFNDIPMTLSSGTARTDKYGSFEHLKFNVPAVAGGTSEVKAKDKANKVARSEFTVAAASFSPTTGFVDTEVTVSGIGFIANKDITIYFAGIEVTTSPASMVTDNEGSFSGSFNVPACVSSTYKLEASDGINTVEADFIVSVAASLSQTTGNVGTELTVAGIGFSGRVSIKYDDVEMATATAEGSEAFSVKFRVPKSKHGNHIVTLSDGTITEQFTFTMESTPPPTPAPLLPEMGIKAKAEAYFDWKHVTDPSGLTYTLQIASDEEFTSIVVEKKNLTGSEYTITEEEKLMSVSKKAPYYWRVKAIDGASNESRWSGTGSFYVGFVFTMPQWAIYTLFGIGALLLGFLAFWVGRRTAYYR